MSWSSLNKQCDLIAMAQIYGFFNRFNVTDINSFDDLISKIKLREQFWTFRFAVDEISVNVGGLTLYGAGFGNHDQDILIRVYLI
ncbi:hypothetical protein [Paenibacillus monticola]|uniref:hypothetical protein n=1 Tax=Paenibacillus monticola TaxID=2666075 RepID=UPI001E51593E|nr:hypothetical protein [Paenibacillus monticola]